MSNIRCRAAQPECEKRRKLINTKKELKKIVSIKYSTYISVDVTMCVNVRKVKEINNSCKAK